MAAINVNKTKSAAWYFTMRAVSPRAVTCMYARRHAAMLCMLSVCTTLQAGRRTDCTHAACDTAARAQQARTRSRVSWPVRQSATSFTPLSKISWFPSSYLANSHKVRLLGVDLLGGHSSCESVSVCLKRARTPALPSESTFVRSFAARNQSCPEEHSQRP